MYSELASCRDSARNSRSLSSPEGVQKNRHERSSSRRRDVCHLLISKLSGPDAHDCRLSSSRLKNAAPYKKHL